jgi:hypothetical protein
MLQVPTDTFNLKVTTKPSEESLNMLFTCVLETDTQVLAYAPMMPSRAKAVASALRQYADQLDVENDRRT